ncbi:MAG: hypothetical protein ABIP17_06930 [Ilumatobacteraceae bacterium]
MSAHDHDGHDHSWREENPAPGPASMLDIGGDIGAATVVLTDDTRSGELMACPRGRPADHFHTGVHRRPAGDVEAWIAVFPSISEGEYSLLTDDGCEHTPFTVVGGEVTTLSMSNACDLVDR